MQPDTIIDAARRYIGVRFRHQGRSACTGVDCLGLLVCVSQDLGLGWPQQLHKKMQENDYSHLPDEQYLRNSIEMFLWASSASTPRPGEIALMKVDGRVQHLGIIAMHPIHEVPTIIHAYAPARKVVEHVLDNRWHAAIMQRYKLALPGLG